MEITYLGHSCFKIKGKDLTLVIDPFDPKIGYKMPKVDADVVLSTHDHFDHNNISAVNNYRLLVNTPGEYEINGTFITGMATYHDDKNGEARGENTVFLINIDGFNILHLGDLGHELPDDILEDLDTVDILLIPVGGVYTIDAKIASEVISSIEPSIVVPMHYKTLNLLGVPDIAPLEDFLNEMGIKGDYNKQDKLKLSSKSDLPTETEVIVLNQSH